MENQRIIKFRAWKTKSKVLSYVAFLSWLNGGLKAAGAGSTLDNGWVTVNKGKGKKTFEGVEPEVILMQYTGLKDNTGREIYEGDIVRDHTTYVDLYGMKGIFENNKVMLNLLVQWSEREARFWLVGDFRPEGQYYQYSDKLHDRKLEVIGNVWENPELMEVKL